MATVTIEDPLWFSATRMLGLMAERSLSPVELVEASLDRLDRTNSALNFVTARDDGAARAAARASETAYREGRARALEGIPVAIKDLTPTSGLATRLGSTLWKDWVPDHDAVVVARLKAAGAIVVAKTTTSEFANASVTESPLHGTTRNPWNTGRTPGGSSGGSAVAVATGCVPMAEGSDMGGSVRIPASFCGLVGLKPALGRIPVGHLPNAFDRLAHHGPITRHVEDAALFLSVTAGPDDRDPLSLPNPPHEWLASRERTGLRIGVTPDLGFQAVEPDIVEAFEQQVARLAARGHRVEAAPVRFDDALMQAGLNIFAANMAACYGDLLDRHQEALDPTLVRFIDIGLSLSGRDLAAADLVRTRHWESLAGLFGRFDVLLCPTMPRTAPTLGIGEFDVGGTDNAGRSRHFDLTLPFNLFGQLPAMTIPSGLGQDGLPAGLQIIGRRYDEPTVLSLAAQLHEPWGWTERLRRLGSSNTC